MFCDKKMDIVLPTSLCDDVKWCELCKTHTKNTQG